MKSHIEDPSLKTMQHYNNLIMAREIMDGCTTTEVLSGSEIIKKLQENLEEEQQKLGVQKNGTR